jgi:hypothetical protein
MAIVGKTNVQRFYMEQIAKQWKVIFESNETLS